MRNRWIILAAIISALAIGLIYFASYSYFKTDELQRAQSRVSLYRSTLINALERFYHLPYILARDPFIIEGAAGKDIAGLNLRLEKFSRQSGLEAIYLLDTTGLTIAASNHNSPVTFMNQNYGFRPYFKAAMAGRRGTFFGIGATTSRPGYFIAEPVYNGEGKILGAIALKLELTELQQAWKSGGETVFVSNKDGVVVLSSNSEWLYQTLSPITKESRAKILAGKQFSNQPLNPVKWQKDAAGNIIYNGATYMHVTSPVSEIGWQIHYLAEETRVQERALFSVIIGGIAISLWLTIFAFMRSKRIRMALEASQQDRRLLQATNVKLEQEIEERRMAEQMLEKAQSALARASKLAALGQLSASVTHELGQPIAAMRNYLTAAELDNNNYDHTKTLERLGAIVIRMEHITKQLRFFAKPGEDQLELIDLRDVLNGARELITHTLSANEVELKTNISDKPGIIKGNRLRLEQVLINLINNSIAAMEQSLISQLKVSIKNKDDHVILEVADTGTGVGDRTIEKLQEPFHTTRESGRGMGLGLAISAAIVKEHEGQLSVENLHSGGARFILQLPLARQESET